VSPVKYELGSYMSEDDILHSHCREIFKSYIELTGWNPQRRSNVSPVRYELCVYIPEDDILHSHSRRNLKTYTARVQFYICCLNFLLFLCVCPIAVSEAS
jgi:hypothetical protein